MTRTRLFVLGLVALAVVCFLLYAGSTDPRGREHETAPSRSGAVEPGLATAQRPQARPAPVAETPKPDEVEAPRSDKSAGGVIRGVVLSAYGDPMARIQVRSDKLGWAFTDDAGAFAYDVPRPGTYTLRARIGGSFDGTATQKVTTDAHGNAGDVRLRFAADNSVRGRALLPDGRPASGVLVKIASASSSMGLGRFAESIWSDFSFRSWLACRTDEDGAFSFGGIDPYPRMRYALWWLGDDGQPVRHADDVKAGQSDLRIEVARHRVQVVPLDGQTGERIADAQLFVHDARAKPHDDVEPPLNRGSEWDERGFIAPAGRTLRVVAFASGYAHVDTTYVMKQACGTQHVELRMQPRPDPGARLELEARDPEGRIVEGMTFRRTYVDEHGAEVMDLAPTTLLPPCRVRVRTAGRKRLSGWDDPSLLLLEASRTIDVPKTGAARLQLDMARGGAAVLTFRLPKDQGHYRGHYLVQTTLRDEQGGIVLVRWSDSTRPPPGHREGVLDTENPSRSTALPPGRYRLTVYEDFASIDLKPVTVPVEIHAGRLTQVLVQLRREGEEDR